MTGGAASIDAEVDPPAYSASQIAAIQRRTLWVLSSATVLGGLGVGATLSVGALLLAEVSGEDALSGLASAMFNGGAALAGIPLARLAMRRGRRRALVTGSLISMVGAMIAVFSTVIGLWWLLAAGLAMVGVASAVQLLSRFSAADLAVPEKRARDLSLVVWSITIGAVVGPNLMGPGAFVGALIGVTPLAGVFVFTVFAQIAAALVNWLGLRPDPLLTAQHLARTTGGHSPNDPGVGAVLGDRWSKILVIFVIAMAQAIMVALMAMTPLHLVHTGGSNELVGVTLSLHIAGMFALSPVFGILASRFGRLPVIGLGWALMLVAVVLAYLSGPSHLLVQVAMTTVGLGWGAITVAGAALLTEITAAHERPRWQGRSDTIMSAAGAVAGTLSGVIFAIGDFSFLALLSGLLLLAGAVASLQIGLRGPHRRNAMTPEDETAVAID